MIKVINVWREGYSINGNTEKAHCIGSVEASSLYEAVLLIQDVQFELNKGVLSVWGCRLFDNEIDARKLFG